MTCHSLLSSSWFPGQPQHPNEREMWLRLEGLSRLETATNRSWIFSYFFVVAQVHEKKKEPMDLA